MNNLAGALINAVESDTVGFLNGSSDDDKIRLALKIYDWLRFEARKKAVFIAGDPFKVGSSVYVIDARWFPELANTDLTSKFELELVKLTRMAKSLRFSVVSGRLSVDTVGDGGQTLLELAFGSSWFDGHSDIVSFMATELLNPTGYLLR